MVDSTTGAPGKGGTYSYSDPIPESAPVFSETPEVQTTADIDTGSGYYRNPYASGYGMGYQNPMMSAYSPAKGGSRYAPRYGMLGPTGFGAYGAYSPFDTYNPYANIYNPYAGMSPFGAKGGPLPPTGDPAPVDEPVVETPVYEVDPVVETGVQTSPDAPVEAAPPDPRLTPLDTGNTQFYEDGSPRYDDLGMPVLEPEPFPFGDPMDAADVDFSAPTLQGAAIASDGSNVVDFTPYTGDEYVRIGDQVVSRAELQRRGSDYYTRPIQQPPMRRQQYPMYGGKGGYYR